MPSRQRGDAEELPGRRGFTLLEVLLALSLAVVLLSLLTFSIHVYMKASDSGRDEVEQAQLARVLLRRMADDLRSTVWKNTGEEEASGESASDGNTGSGSSSGSSNSTGSNSTSTGSGGGAGTGTGSGSGSGTGTESGNEGTAAATDSGASSIVEPQVLGLYGSKNEIQVDVSRLPRIEQYASLAPTSTDVISDIRTVAYYCLTSESATSNLGKGLVRRELDQAVTSYASLNGGLNTWEQDLAPLAQEITAIELRYYDGAEKTWLTEWDTQAKGSLPTAVEIAIAMDDPTAVESTDAAGMTVAGQKIYRLVVFIPQSQAPAVSGVSALETLVSSSLSAAANGANGQGQSGQAGTSGGTTPRGGGSSGRGGGYDNQGPPGGGDGPPSGGGGGAPEGGGAPGGGAPGGGGR